MKHLANALLICALAAVPFLGIAAADPPVDPPSDPLDPTCNWFMYSVDPPAVLVDPDCLGLPLP